MKKIKNFIVRHPYVSSILLPIVLILITFFSPLGYYFPIPIYLLYIVVFVLIVATIVLAKGKKRLILIAFWLLPLLIIAFFIWSMRPNLSGMNFDPILWNETEKLEGQDYYTHRCSMAKSLKIILEGQKMLKQEVFELLGQKKISEYNPNIYCLRSDGISFKVKSGGSCYTHTQITKQEYLDNQKNTKSTQSDTTTTTKKTTSERIVSYPLGMCQPMDHYFIDIFFDKNNRVEEVIIVDRG